MLSLNEIGHVHDSREEDFENDHFTTLYSSTAQKSFNKISNFRLFKFPVQCSSVVSCLPTSDQKNLIQLLVNLLHNGWRLAFLGRGRKCIFDFGHHLNGLNQLPVADFWFLLLKENV